MESLAGIEPPRPRRYLWRVLLGCLVVLVAGAGATAVAVVEQVHTIVQDISVTKPLTVDPRVLAQSSYGQPQTLLMVGDDTRSVYKYYTGNVPNLANEMLLVRIDPSKPWISLMSIPRELWVNITEPDGVTYTNRLNSAYTFGTTTLVQTIKQVTGLSVNHVIATTFTQFEAAINQLGCIYDTVDDRYYNLNDGVPGTDYQSINLLPGYQCLNGSAAEQFVSYRHTDSSQIRDARDQSFLLAVKAQYGPMLSSHIGEFERIFGRTVQTDAGLRSASEILNLANLLVTSAGLRVRQVPFQASVCPLGVCPAGDLTASPGQIEASVHSFLYGADVVPKKQVASISHRVAGHGVLGRLGLAPTLEANLEAEHEVAAKLPFTAEFPKVQDLSGTSIPVAAECMEYTGPCIRDYSIRAPDGHAYPIYVEVFSNGDLGQFYDVQGTTWTGAPLFAHPDQTVQVGSRSYELFYNGSHLETVAWRQYGAVYWVHNTLTEAVPNSELLAIAEHTVRVGPVRGLPVVPAPNPVLSAPATHPVSVPSPVTTATPWVQSVGRIGGLVTLVLLPFGLLLIGRSWFKLRSLREHVYAAVVTAGDLEARLAATVTGYGPLAAQLSGPAVATPYLHTDPSDPFSPFGPSDGPAATETGPRTLWRGLLIVAAAVIVVAVATAGTYVALHRSAATPGGAPRRVLPTVGVAVLNEGRKLDAAHRMARTLTAEHVPVVAIGTLRAAAPKRYEVLYLPGEAGQARRLAKLLHDHQPLVAPVNPAAARALGTRAKLVVVIP